MRIEGIRNFAIIAHIDHGKSTLADRILQKLGAISEREFREQVLDDMDLERERGITIKARAVALNYVHDGTGYELNLIDTPGHVDFSYEVSRSLRASEGALLVVDAAQGVEAQTVANAYLALDLGLDIVPILNKIDLPQARSEEVLVEMETTLGLNPGEALRVSARTGQGVDRVLEAVVERVRPPEGDPDAPLRALVFDAVFDDYRGVVVYVRVVDGWIRPGDSIRFMKTGSTHRIESVGKFRPKMTSDTELGPGDVGYIMAQIKDLHRVKVGDTVTAAKGGTKKPLPGYREPQPMVFAGLYPANATEVGALRQALEKLSLNDSSFVFAPESSEALGMGFRCGFLGLLHMEIVEERLEREAGVDLVQTAPNVTYQVVTTKGETIEIQDPSKLPDANFRTELREPIVRAELVINTEHLGAVTNLAEKRRGRHVRVEHLGPKRVLLVYDMPLAEIIYDFFDKLKSATRGYGTMDYEFLGFEKADLVRLDILVAERKVGALSTIVHRCEAETRGRAICRRLKDEIDRHLFPVVLQAAVGGRILARETIPALAKNVTGKCYGGDITRKRKLWAKQRKGKKRMKQFGNVSIPQEAFLAVLGERGSE